MGSNIIDITLDMAMISPLIRHSYCGDMSTDDSRKGGRGSGLIGAHLGALCSLVSETNVQLGGLLMVTSYTTTHVNLPSGFLQPRGLESFLRPGAALLPPIGAPPLSTIRDKPWY